MFRFSRSLPFIVSSLALLTIFPGGAAGAAKDFPRHARVIIDETFTDEWICGPPDEGIPVDLRFQVDGNGFQFLGKDGFVYFKGNGITRWTWISDETGRSITGVSTGVTKDQSITDNGDGTITVLSVTAGDNFAVRGADGEILFRDAGRFVLSFLIDAAGTPGDPDDDIVLDVQLVERVGTDLERFGDVCAAAAASLGV